MDHQEQHKQEHQKKHEQEYAQEKLRDQAAENRDKKGWVRTPRPFWLILVGVVLTLGIVLGWIMFWRP